MGLPVAGQAASIWMSRRAEVVVRDRRVFAVAGAETPLEECDALLRFRDGLAGAPTGLCGWFISNPHGIGRP